MKNTSLFTIQLPQVLSKRDLFAAAALVAIILSSDFVRLNRGAVKLAVRWADALLAELGGE